MKLDPNQIIPDTKHSLFRRFMKMMSLLGCLIGGIFAGILEGAAESIKMVVTVIIVCVVGLFVLLYFYDGITPPVEVTFRETLVPGDHTKVLQVWNCGDDTLALQIDAYNDDYNQHARHTFTVKPGRHYELGRVEMNWHFEQGERYTIKATNYLLPYKGTVP